MHSQPESTPTLPAACPLMAEVRAVCRRIPPVWPLTHFVAVNPFLGLADRPFVDACHLLGELADGGMLMPPSWFREQQQSGAITPADLQAALVEARAHLPAGWHDALNSLSPSRLETWLTEAPETRPRTVFTIAEMADRTRGTSYSVTIVEEIARFCAAYYDAGQSSWRMPWQELRLWPAWRAEAALDVGPELLGLRGFRALAGATEEDAAEFIVEALAEIGIGGEARASWLHRQLCAIRGWAGYVQYRVRENEAAGLEDDSLIELLAVALAYDLAVHRATGVRPPSASPRAENQVDTLAHYLWQAAFEHGGQRQFLGQLQAAPEAAFQARSRPAVQAVFCIDVRSEVFRRALESTSPDCETRGFAGFFGLPIEYIPFGTERGGAHCPVLLRPAYRVRETLTGVTPEGEEQALAMRRVSKRLGHSWNSFKTSAISCFSFVEITGLFFGAKLARDAFAPAGEPARNAPAGPALELRELPGGPTGIPPADQVQLARGLLRHMGLTKDFARLVLFCGHGSVTENNPYGSSLDCGACGGHTGEASARVAAAILNRPEVRAELIADGVVIPADAWFLAGLHQTTTDDVTLFDTALVPPTHAADLAALRGHLAHAGTRARRERATLLHVGGSTERTTDAVVRARSRDWAQVRPEWGLARNAAFIVAPRARTEALNFGGRAFLHDYDHTTDVGSATLEVILTAPMVVTNWINLQYYAATVNNPFFGSGNKVLHNVVGTFGVCLGNGGDLQPGLPLQSVHDGVHFVHEPHRLNVFVEAPCEKITAILARHDAVRQLVDHGWLHLFALENAGARIFRYRPTLQWEGAIR